MNVVVLMAGSSHAFNESDCNFPKPLVEIDGKPMLERVVDNITSLITHNNKIIFIIRKSDNDKYYLSKSLSLLVPECTIIPAPSNTSGAAVTALLAIEEVNMSKPMVIINGDQIIDIEMPKILKKFNSSDAGVLVFKSVHPRWSYVRCNEAGYVTESAEKRPISNLATAGFYFYKEARLYFDAVKRMIMKDSHINNIFYICPVFNEIILDGGKILAIRIKKEQYHSLMTPKMAATYESFLLSNSQS